MIVSHSSPPRAPVALVDGAVTGLAVRPPDSAGLPLMVYLPGGGSSVLGLDVPGHSHLEAAARNGLAAVALNRPAQRDSRPLDLDPAADEGAFAANAQRLMEAIAELWSEHDDQEPGIVLYGCSVGGAIALHVAARWSALAEPQWPLLGLAVSDIGQSPPDEVVAMWRALPLVETIDLVDYLDRLPRAPAWTRPAELSGSPPRSLPVPRAELQEVVGGWVRDWERICSAIRVPVHYRLAEHDNLWNVGDDLVGAFADALRHSSPYVDAGFCQGAAHNLPVNVVGPSYILEVLAFAHRCLAFARVPQLLE